MGAQRVKMKDTLILRYQQCSEFNYKDTSNNTVLNEMQAVKKYHGMNAYFELKEFLKSIENKVINLVFIGEDAFEETNNNFWLPQSLWSEIEK